MKQKLIGKGVSPNGTAIFETNWDPVPMRRYVTATLFVFMNAGVFFYWTAFPLANTIYEHGYPRAGTPPSPNSFQSARYTWDWWMIWLLGLNAFLPMLFAFALANNSIEEFTRLHKFFSTMAMLMNALIVVFLTVQWLFFCNSTFQFLGRACADYRWCCVYFPSEWCPNAVPCTPNVTSAMLERNHVMMQHWVFSFVFLVLAFWNTSINKDMREFGLLH